MMRKLLLIMVFVASTLAACAQTGIGWSAMRAKYNFRDSTNFERGFRINNIQVTLNGQEFNILDGALVSTTELNRIVGVRENIRIQLDDTTTLDYEINARTGSYTLSLTDNWKVITINSSSANTLTVPPNSTVALPIGASITICCIGSGQTTIAAGSGVTIYSRGSLLDIIVLGDATLLKIGTDTWKLIGSLE